jgi:hypothetical protein
MNLSKYRLLKIIREEIATVREGAEDAFAELESETAKFDAEKKTAAPATTAPATAAPATTAPATAAPATTAPATLSRADAAFADADAAHADAEKKYGKNYNVTTTSQTRESLERTIREEIEAYLAEDGDKNEPARPRIASSPDAAKNIAAVDRLDAVTPRVKRLRRLRRRRREAREAAAKGGGGEELQEKEDNSFSKAGEEIEKKGTEGVFTAKADKAGMGVQAYAAKVLAKDSKASTKTKRQAAFAKGAATVARENK